MGPVACTASRDNLGTKADCTRFRPYRIPVAGPVGWSQIEFFLLESLILAQDERWRRALHMQVVRERETSFGWNP